MSDEYQLPLHVLSSYITYSRVCNKIKTAGATSGAEAAYYSGVHPVFSRVRVARSLVLCFCFVERCFSFCPLSFGHCVFCPFSIYGF